MNSRRIAKILRELADAFEEGSPQGIDDEPTGTHRRRPCTPPTPEALEQVAKIMQRRRAR